MVPSTVRFIKQTNKGLKCIKICVKNAYTLPILHMDRNLASLIFLLDNMFFEMYGLVKKRGWRNANPTIGMAENSTPRGFI